MDLTCHNRSRPALSLILLQAYNTALLPAHPTQCSESKCAKRQLVEVTHCNAHSCSESASHFDQSTAPTIHTDGMH